MNFFASSFNMYISMHCSEHLKCIYVFVMIYAKKRWWYPWLECVKFLLVLKTEIGDWTVKSESLVVIQVKFSLPRIKSEPIIILHTIKHVSDITLIFHFLYLIYRGIFHYSVLPLQMADKCFTLIRFKYKFVIYRFHRWKL